MSMNDISYTIETNEFKLFKEQSNNKNFDCFTPDLINSFNYITDIFLKHYSDICKSYDEAPDFCCFEKKYIVQPSSSFRIELDILNTIANVLRRVELQYVSLIKFITVLGRFMFANYTLIRQEKESTITLYLQLLENTLSILYRGSWPFKDTIIIKLFLLNLLDSLSENKEEGLRRIADNSLIDNYNSVSHEIINATIDLYIERAIRNSLTVNSIGKNWIYAYIYKKRFGYIYCKDFTVENKASSLFSMRTLSLSNKDLKTKTVLTAQKVVLFEAGNIKRSSNYVPTEDSSFFNISTLRFE